MKAVQPIRDMELLNKCYDIAREHDKHRRTGEVSWELLLLIGFNTSLRISDIRRFRVRDLRGRDYAEIKAQKTGKEARILINPPARRAINRLLSGRPGDEYVLQSKQRDAATHKPRAITRQRAYQIINEIARRAGITLSFVHMYVCTQWIRIFARTRKEHRVSMHPPPINPLLEESWFCSKEHLNRTPPLSGASAFLPK